MLLFIEGHQYKPGHKVGENKPALTVEKILQGVDVLKKDIASYKKKKKKKIQLNYVGYCYSKVAEDIVFFLPKVVKTGKENTIFGASPEGIIDLIDQAGDKFTEEIGKFLSELAVRIYQAINVYRQTHKSSDNILQSEHQKESTGKRQQFNTLLDVILALRDFNKNNQEYFTFIAKNVHSGYNKINWNKTIAKSQAIVQNGTPVYMNPVNRKKTINFDEELLIIYFSILNYIRENYSFAFTVNIRYPLISPEQLENAYIARRTGIRRLKQIKYKYFSDKARKIWELCYAFFDHKMAMNRPTEDYDYLLAKNFQSIFQAMNDALIADNETEPLRNKLFGKTKDSLLDHLFIGKGLVEPPGYPAEKTYYIGDSKYYKFGTKLSNDTIEKQFRYAKEVKKCTVARTRNKDLPRLRDCKLTKGCNPVPNFFISARIPKEKDNNKFSFDDNNLKVQEKVRFSHNKNIGLFDRDTLFLHHYDVNFSFIVKLYGCDNKSRQAAWREDIRRQIRNDCQKTLNCLYEFYTLRPLEGKDWQQFIRENFKRLNGKLYRPNPITNPDCLVLALMKDNETDWEKLGVTSKTVSHEVAQNGKLLQDLETHFEVSQFELRGII